jgi:hypothetical protein
MKLATFLSIVLSFAWLTSSVARADERRGEEHHGGEHRDQRPQWHGAPPQVRNTEHRQEAPRWQPHPGGVHPQGPKVRPHTVRVLRPQAVHYGAHPWRHWQHPVFARPVYYWDWPVVRQVTCIAEDSYGDQYPVTEETWRGFALNNMTDVEDDALDRCYQESGGDPSCYLATCSHF